MGAGAAMTGSAHPLEAQPRRVRRRRWRGAHLVMVLAGLLGLVLTLTALRQEPTGRRVAVANGPLEAGVRLGRSDVRFERVSGADDVLSALVDADDAWRGKVVTARIETGEPLTQSRLRAAATTDGRRAMSIPVERARAVNGRLAPGDRVDVVQAAGGGALVVAADLEVLDVEDDRDGAFGGARGQVTITLAVDVAGSQRLAAVLADGDFVLTRVTGAVSAADAVAPGGVVPAGTTPR